jgi:hypothetical protein
MFSTASQLNSLTKSRISGAVQGRRRPGDGRVYIYSK